MDLYFNYKIYGTKEELQDALHTLSFSVNKSKDLKEVFDYRFDISKNINGDDYVLLMTNEIYCNENIKVDFLDVMYDLSRMFINLYITGIAYTSDGFYNKWEKMVGDIDFSIEDKASCIISMRDYDEVLDRFECYNELIETDFYIDGELFKVDGNFVEKTVTVKNKNFYIDVELILNE